MTKIIKESLFISRIFEDYSNSTNIKIGYSLNLVTLTFLYESEEIVTYRFKKDFYNQKLKSLIEPNSVNDKLMNLDSKKIIKNEI